MKEGDIVVLRLGTDKVHAVGQVVGPYEWHEEFGDVDGWDLQHIRRVRWLWHDLSNPKDFGTYGLKQGDTTQRLNEGPVTKWLSTLAILASAHKRSLTRLPAFEEMNGIDVEEISEFLFDNGVASISIKNLVDEIDELTRIAKWYQRSANKPSEHETVAYLIVPLLRALGWTPQRMAVSGTMLMLRFSNNFLEKINLSVLWWKQRRWTTPALPRSGRLCRMLMAKLDARGLSSLTDFAMASMSATRQRKFFDFKRI